MMTVFKNIIRSMAVALTLAAVLSCETNKSI